MFQRKTELIRGPRQQVNSRVQSHFLACSRKREATAMPMDIITLLTAETAAMMTQIPELHQVDAAREEVGIARRLR